MISSSSNWCDLDEQYAQKKIEAEKAELSAIELKLTEADKAEIVKNASLLKERQDQPQGTCYNFSLNLDWFHPNAYMNI